MIPKRVEVKVSTIIAQPAEGIFDFVADYENDPNWRAGVTSMRHDPPGPVHVGMHTHEVMRFFGRAIRVEAEIVSVDPGRSVSFRSVAGPLQAEGVRRVEPQRSGTLVTYEAMANLTGVLSLLAPLVVRSFRKRAQGDLDRLRELLEGSARGHAPSPM